jgi:hypothetical protein
MVERLEFAVGELVLRITAIKTIKNHFFRELSLIEM